MIQRATELFLQAARSHPGSLTMITVGGSAFAGWILFTIIENRQQDESHIEARKTMSHEQARLRAMIENAKESTWQENLDNAVKAQEHFMLPGRSKEVPDFMANIEQRSMDIMKKQQEKMEREKKRKITTRMWN
jgi:hypothetical protein